MRKWRGGGGIRHSYLTAICLQYDRRANKGERMDKDARMDNNLW